MNRKKILWLVSWYPNRNDIYDGDFIQRHARAAAIFHDIHVIYVTGGASIETVEENWNFVTGLTEQVIYYKRTSTFFQKLHENITWAKVFKNAIRSYIRKNGLPSCVHVHVPWKAGMMGLWMKRHFKTPFILSEHWGIYNKKQQDYFKKRSPIFQVLMRRIYQSSGALVTVSHALGGEVELVMGKKSDAIISNVVDTSLFYLKAEKYSRFTFIHVSNMAPVKNVRGILEAFYQMLIETKRKDVQLLMIGNRDNEFQHLAQKMGMLESSVQFMGEISYANVAEHVRRSHCFVLFSESETFSCVTAEALCSGLPVIASATGALPELINQQNGILVSPIKVQHLVKAMKDVLTGEALFNSKIIASQASEKFGYSKVSKDFDLLYATVCQ